MFVKITNFQQKFGKTFNEAWGRFKDLLNKRPRYGFSPLHQIDTFYNGLNQSDQDSLNSAVGGNLLTRNTQEALTIIKNKYKVRTSRNKPQVLSASGSSSQIDAITALIKQVEALSGLTTVEPSIPPLVPLTPIEGVEKEPETLMDEVHITSLVSTAHVPPLGIQPVSPPKTKEDPKPNPHQPKIPYPSRLNKTKPLDKNDVQVSKFLKILKQLCFDISLMDSLTQIPKYSKGLKDLLKDKEKLEELANTSINVECSAILLNKVSEKLGDPRKVLIPCVLQDLKILRLILVPIILGRPFLRTAKALVDLYEEKLTLRIWNEELSSGSTTSHSNLSLSSYESFCFGIDHQEEKSSGSTTSQSDHSLPDYEAFCFDHQEEKRSGSTTSHSDPSLFEYESFYFDISIDTLPPADRSDSHHEEFANELAHIISPTKYDHFYFDIEDVPGELNRLLIENSSSKNVNLTEIKEDNGLKTKTLTKELTIYELNDLRLLLSNCDSTFSEEFSEIDFLVSFPFENKDNFFQSRDIHYQRS
ncbi:hypothetical protein Tco_1368610 [Tanacetum coccineum]